MIWIAPQFNSHQIFYTIIKKQQRIHWKTTSWMETFRKCQKLRILHRHQNYIQAKLEVLCKVSIKFHKKEWEITSQKRATWLQRVVHWIMIQANYSYKLKKIINRIGRMILLQQQILSHCRRTSTKLKNFQWLMRMLDMSWFQLINN